MEHDLCRHTVFVKLLKRDAHAAHGLRRPLHVPHLGDVGTEIRDRVDGKHSHIGDIGETELPALDPFCFVGLQLVQFFGEEFVLAAQETP